MRRTGAGSVAVLVVALAIVSSACSRTEETKPLSDQPSPTVGTGGAGASLDDDEFVRDVALKNMAAVELARLAVNRATDPNIKTFAQQMIDDHGAAGNNLKSVVAGRPIEWPAQLDDKHRESAEELATKHGVDFDRDYLEAVVESEQNLAAKLESRLDVQSLAEWKTAAAGRTNSKDLPAATAMRDVQVRPSQGGNDVTTRINQWAADTYPVAQKHLDTARRLETEAKKRSTNS